MARHLRKLTDREVKAIKSPGLHRVDANLYLNVSEPPEEGRTGATSWIFRYMLRGKARQMGLGGYPTISLSDARSLADAARTFVKKRVDPIELRKKEEADQAAEAAKAMTFKECAKALIVSKKAGWRNPKHRQQWANTLETYAYPVLGKVSVNAIDTAMVLKVVKPIWATKPETASRLRGRIEAVLSWATVHHYREGPNPARWRGHLDQILPARSKVRRVKHHSALPYSEIGMFVRDLREHTSIGALGLQFLILTAARTGEVIGATWDEIDLAQKVWTIPAQRMKTEKEHRIPLSDCAIAVLEQLKKHQVSEFIFPGQVKRRPLSNMAFLQLLKRMKRGDLTAHGFRSTFRDWAAERTGYPREVAEAALAHTIGNKVEAAYRRSDLFEKRRRLMSDWADFCETLPADGVVVPMWGKTV